jgi:diguanylate cyclase (GGDEF)-like protein/PAS domain S-box-containing protein
MHMGLTRWAAKLPDIEQWSIGKKIFFGNIFFLLIPLLTVFTVLLHFTLAHLNRSIEVAMEAAGASIAGMIETSIDASLRNYLRGVAEYNLQQIERARKKWAEDGSRDEAKLKQEIFNALGAQKIGPSGYIYCIDSSGVVQFHPHETLIGHNILHREEYKEAWPFIRQQIAAKRGYLEYSWQNPDEDQPQPKALYMEYFRPWDWIIAVVCYRDEVEQLIDFKDIARRMADARYGPSGYAFLLNGQGQLLAHPFISEKDRAEAYAARLRPILAAASASRQQTVRIPWQDAPGQGEKERLLYLHHMPPFNLTIGVTTDVTGAYAGLLTTWVIALIVVLAGMVFAVFAALFLGRWIAAPLRRFVGQLEVSGQEQGFAGGCETTFLVNKFDEYVKKERGVNEKLVVEVQRRKSAETFLLLYKKIFDSATEGMMITDESARILAVNETFTTITGYDQAEAIGQNPRMLKSDQHDAGFYAQMWRQLLEQGSWEGEIWNRKKDGTVYPEWLTINGIRNEQREIAYYFATFFEIGELKKKEKQIAFMAYHDLLTRLPNRSSLEHKLAKTLARVRTAGGKVSLLYIDLDNFKNINDVFGHKHGDDLLVQVSQRLSSVLTGDNVLCRIGGDEFILLMDHIDNESMIYLTAGRIQAILKKPFLLDFKKIYVNASIGISVYPGDGDSPLDLIRSADMAMHKAKREGKNRHALFCKEMHEELYEKLRTENGIRYGLLNREFIVHYQPKVNISTRKTASLEALIRWEKGGKLISPAAFIPVAEESSLIDDLCLLVLQDTCAFLAVMQKDGVAVPISVNISPRQFHNLDFVDIVEDLLGRYRVEPRFIEFEITETTAMKDVDHTLNIMHRLRELGILFSIDDFGTGYSSLGSLNKMPVSTLKIDKQFIDDLQTNSGIVATIIAISQHMRLNVVAEGVETEEQLLRLGTMGCHEAQGYYFSRPVSGDDIVRYLLAEGSEKTAKPSL